MTVPPQEAIERRLVTQKAAAKIEVPFDYDPRRHQPIRRYFLRLDPPDLADQTDDWARVTRALAALGVPAPRRPWTCCAACPSILRGENCSQVARSRPKAMHLGRGPAPWEVTAVVALDSWDRPDGPPQLLALLPGDRTDRNFGAAVDIGTTTVSVWLVDLESGEVVAQAADYNGQIARGEDVISRIIYAKKDERLAEMQRSGGRHDQPAAGGRVQAGRREHG